MPGFDRDTLKEIYRKRAGNYDLYATLFPLVGFRPWHYRRQAVQALDLQRGDPVVDIGCGTGLNFPLLQEAVGPQGSITGVDLSEAMLAQARDRVRDRDWSNVELVQGDAGAYQFPDGVAGIISTYAITLVPEHEQVIRNGCQALKPGGHWAIADFKVPSNALSALAPLFAWLLVRPFGGTLDLAKRHPWESIERYLQNTKMTEYYLGFAYVIVGERSEPA